MAKKHSKDSHINQQRRAVNRQLPRIDRCPVHSKPQAMGHPTIRSWFLALQLPVLLGPGLLIRIKMHKRARQSPTRLETGLRNAFEGVCSVLNDQIYDFRIITNNQCSSAPDILAEMRRRLEELNSDDNYEDEEEDTLYDDDEEEDEDGASGLSYAVVVVTIWHN